MLRERPEPPAEWVRLWPGAPALDAPAHRAWLDAEIGREPGLADTHPGLAARVGALGCMTEELHALPAPRAGASAALAWLGPSLDGLRDRIAQDWSARVGPGWRERHESRRKARAQLAWLRGLPSPTLTERLEVFWLQSELEPRHDTLPEIVAFNTAHPNQVRGLTLEAALRLRKGDASGLPLLDRAMEIDADATPQACELALRHLASRDDPRAQAYAGRWKRHLAKQAKPARGW